MIHAKVREQIERLWGGSAHSKCVNKAIGRHSQASKDEARADALSEVLAIFDAHDAEPQEDDTFGDGSARGCCGEYETGSGEHGDECEETVS